MNISKSTKVDWKNVFALFGIVAFVASVFGISFLSLKQTSSSYTRANESMNISSPDLHTSPVPPKSTNTITVPIQYSGIRGSVTITQICDPLGCLSASTTVTSQRTQIYGRCTPGTNGTVSGTFNYGNNQQNVFATGSVFCSGAASTITLRDDRLAVTVLNQNVSDGIRTYRVEWFDGANSHFSTTSLDGTQILDTGHTVTANSLFGACVSGQSYHAEVVYRHVHDPIWNNDRRARSNSITCNGSGDIAVTDDTPPPPPPPGQCPSDPNHCFNPGATCDGSRNGNCGRLGGACEPNNACTGGFECCGNFSPQQPVSGGDANSY